MTVDVALNAAWMTIGTHRFPVRSYAYPRHTASRKIAGHVHMGCTTANSADVARIASHDAQIGGTVPSPSVSATGERYGITSGMISAACGDTDPMPSAARPCPAPTGVAS